MPKGLDRISLNISYYPLKIPNVSILVYIEFGRMNIKVWYCKDGHACRDIAINNLIELSP
jgi:hypothetical protein